MKKKIIIWIFIIIMIINTTAYADLFYYDVYNHWAENYIYMTSNDLKLFNGYDDLSFRPENHITRAEFITILFRAADGRRLITEIHESNINYIDFNIKHWSYTYVISMREYINNKQLEYSFEDVFSEDVFMPDKPITRKEVIALTSVFSAEALTDNTPNFIDVNNTNEYWDEVIKLFNNGIIEGYQDKTLRLENEITRAESAKMIYKIFDDMKYISNKYLDDIELILLDGENIFSIFGDYDYNNLSEMDKKYIKVKNTLEYTSFGGYIFPEDEVLYDKNTEETLKQLKNENYYNIAGMNFYLLKFGNIEGEEKNVLAHELLIEILERNDLKDSDIMQILSEVITCSVRENFFIAALEKWNNSTEDENIKANILFMKYDYYIRTNNKAMLNQLLLSDQIHNRLIEIDKEENTNNENSSSSNPAIIVDNDNSSIETTIENETISEDNLTNSAIENETVDEDNVTNSAIENETVGEDNVTNSAIENETISEDNITNSVITDEEENIKISDDIYYKDILNRALVLYYLERYNDGYEELMKDWEFLKKTNLYLEKHLEIDIEIKGTAKKIKTRLLFNNSPILIQ